MWWGDGTAWKEPVLDNYAPFVPAVCTFLKPGVLAASFPALDDNALMVLALHTFRALCLLLALCPLLDNHTCTDGACSKRIAAPFLIN